MASVSSLINNTSAVAAGKDKPHDLKDLDIDQFLQLMVTELTNQDPLNPMDNTQLVQQIGEIRQISATTQLSETLLAVSSGQSLSTASSLIGKHITALGANNENLSGVVDKVTVDIDPKNSDKRTYNVHIGTQSVSLKNVREVLP